MKWIMLTLLVLISYTSSQAQRADDRKERIKALKTAFITEELQLTSDQAQQFWPIYNELERELEALREQRQSGSPETMNDAQTEVWVRQQLDLEAQQIAVKRQYVDKFSKVLNWQQIAKLLKVEHRFKQELLRRMRERRRDGGR